MTIYRYLSLDRAWDNEMKRDVAIWMTDQEMKEESRVLNDQMREKLEELKR